MFGFWANRSKWKKLWRLPICFYCLPNTKALAYRRLEAMAAHVPVISSDAGGLPEVNIDGVTGFMAKTGDIETMSRCAIDLLQQ